MHYWGEKLGQNRGRDPERHQNLVNFSLGHIRPLQKFHQNPFVTFLDILHADTDTDTDTHRQTATETQPPLRRKELFT